jgi:ATP-dependent RNA helicase RhlE
VSFHRFHGRRPHSGRAQHSSASAPPRPEPVVRAAPSPVTPEVAAAIESSPFTKLGLAPKLVRAVLEEGYTDPSPVQTEVIPPALSGRDVLACAQTGTGKTAGFVLPILQALSAEAAPGIRALILTPTRELAGQIGERITAYGKYLGLQHVVIYGGVSQRTQQTALRASPSVVVATPGRLLDLVQQRLIDLRGITHFVLDEMDRMLDMGFVHDVRRIVSMIPVERQTLFFSATIAPPVEKLARGMLRDPARVAISPVTTTAPTIEQSVIFVAQADKRGLLETVLRDQTVERALIFTRTKHGANRLSAQLERAGFGVAAIHGNKTQNARERALDAFKRGVTPVLVATDVAARGIDVEGVSLVVNFDMPNVAESYVHRIGRTGRAGATGRAISFCDRDERPFLGDIERLIRKRLPVTGDDGQASAPANDGHRAPASNGGHRPGRPGANGGHRAANPGSNGGPSSTPPDEGRIVGPRRPGPRRIFSGGTRRYS